MDPEQQNCTYGYNIIVLTYCSTSIGERIILKTEQISCLVSTAVTAFLKLCLTAFF